MDNEIIRLAKLISYCRHHESQKDRGAQRRLLEKIVSQAETIGIKKPFIYFLEVDLSERGPEINIGETDIVFVDNQKRLFLVEVKVTTSYHIKYGLIRRQLHTAHDFFLERYGLAAQLFGAYKKMGSGKIICYCVEPPNHST